MSPKDVAALRSRLELNPLQLAERLGVPPRLVLQWESGDRFPTKRHCQMMQGLLVPAPGESPAATGDPNTQARPAPPAAPRDNAEFAAVVVQRLLAEPAFERQLRTLVSDYLSSSSSSVSASTSQSSSASSAASSSSESGSPTSASSSSESAP